MTVEWKYVPVEPTREMLDAAFEACRLDTPDWLAIRYRAMCLAAPRALLTRLSEDHIVTLYGQFCKGNPPPGLMTFAQEIEFIVMQRLWNEGD